MLTVLLSLLLAAALLVLVTYLTRDTAVSRVRSLGDGNPADDNRHLDPGDALFRGTVEILAGTRLAPGSEVRVIADGDVLFDCLLRDLRSARELITWQVYWHRPGATADRVADVLAARARAGVPVLVLLDAYGSRGIGEGYLRRLREAGADVRLYRPFRLRTAYKWPQRSHVRSVVVDGLVGYTGGFGVDDRWLGEGRRPGQWRDTNVRVIGEPARQLQAAFINNWIETTGELLIGRPVLPPFDADSPPGDTRAGAVCSFPSLGSTPAERLMALSILAARRRLYLTSPYFVPDRDWRGLLRAAAARGTDVRVLTAGASTDQRVARLAARACYEALLRGGVRVYEYRPTMIHAKTLVVDGEWAVIGTINFDNRSLKLNDEVALVAHDERVGRELERLFEADLAYADEMTLEGLARRSRLARLQERGARLMAPLL